MKMNNKIKVLGILLGVLSVMMVFQACDVHKAIYETLQQMQFNKSAHADAAAEAFVHWDEDVPKVVPTSCAKCHSLEGFIDFATNGAVTKAANPGVFNCTLCHTDAERGVLREFENGVTFPSGVTVTELGPEALCMQCHQGRTSKATVDTNITNSGAATEDTVSTKISFSNIHYLAAAATMYGKVVNGGYQYTGKTYDAKFAHIDGYGACTDCHNPHSLEVKFENCKTCHTYVKKEADLKNIRWLGSEVDYNGNGSMTEGIYYEVKGIHDQLLTAIQYYARTKVGVPIGYNGDVYPYFFKDLNDDGIIDTSEAVSANGYKSFTPRLLKACYNYQVVKKDPGGFAHGGKYLIQLMYDSIENCYSVFPSFATLMGNIHRDDEGHFDGSSEAWRHWDTEGEVPSSCARCHSSKGIATFLSTGANTAEETTNGMLCTTCHTSPPSVRQVSSVKFPSNVTVNIGDVSNLCMICHQGRASKNSIDSAIAASGGPYSFTNIHYFPAAAVLFGGDVHGGYEYTGKTYAGRQEFPNHNGKFVTCVQCHMGVEGKKGHNVAEPQKENCVLCHGQDIAQPIPGSDPENFSFDGIRPGSIPDYDADGDITESLKDEIKGLEAALYLHLQAYGQSIGKPMVYDANTYPYWFKDTNGNGIGDPSELVSSNGYKFDAKGLKAAYNYHMSIKEPHGYIHNALYIAQLMVDGIQDLGGSVAAYTWR